MFLEQRMDSPSYPFKPIYSMSALARTLDEPVDLLVQLAQDADDLYRHVPQQKKNGSPRDTYDAFEPLKRVQRKIVDRLLSRVRFPYYVHGGIRDRENPRSIITNAAQHAGARFLVLMDIEDFYPSISQTLAKQVFSHCLKFSPEVSALLASLCCRQGAVPQGASTSGYVANLAFWDVEPALVEWLGGKGLSYSRFADDITISSAFTLSSADRSAVISRITSLLAAKGFRQKRSKLHLRKKGQSVLSKGEAGALTVTGLTVHGSTPNVTKKERREIRAAVYEFEKLAEVGLSIREIQGKFDRAMGRVGRLIGTKHPDGVRLRERLRAAKKLAEKFPPNAL
jgi:hypothetical protein